MSNEIVIQQSGVAENLTVDALRLDKCGGGNGDWVPADGKNLVKLDVGGSGTYKASDYDAYGIASIKVHPRTGDATSAAVPHAFKAIHLPAVKEGGTAYNFSAKLISVDKQGGGTLELVPSSEVTLGTKSVTQSSQWGKRGNYYGWRWGHGGPRYRWWCDMADETAVVYRRRAAAVYHAVYRRSDH